MIQTRTVRTASLALVKSENRLAVGDLLKASEKPIITLHTTEDQIVLIEQFRNYGMLFMKMFYNVVADSIICCAKEARASIVLNIE